MTPTETITFQWHRKHGDCTDCGRPAAYVLYRQRLCSVCYAQEVYLTHGIGTFLNDENLQPTREGVSN